MTCPHVDDLKGELADLEAHLTDVQSAIADMQKELEVTQKHIGSYKQRLVRLAHDLDELRS